MKKIILMVVFILIIFSSSYAYEIYVDDPPGDVIGEFDGVKIYKRPNRDLSDIPYSDIAFECFEYAKRYCYRKYNYLMPAVRENKASNAFKDWNSHAGLKQYVNEQTSVLPHPGDVIIFDFTDSYPYGHIAIISEVDKDNRVIKFAQQNVSNKPFDEVKYNIINGKIFIEPYFGMKTLGWLGKEKPKFEITDVVPKNHSQLRVNQPVMIKFSNELSDEIHKNIKKLIFIQQSNQPVDFSAQIVKGKVLVIKPSNEWKEGQLTVILDSAMSDIYSQKMDENNYYQYNVKKYHLVSTGPQKEINKYKGEKILDTGMSFFSITNIAFYKNTILIGCGGSIYQIDDTGKIINEIKEVDKIKFRTIFNVNTYQDKIFIALEARDTDRKTRRMILITDSSFKKYTKFTSTDKNAKEPYIFYPSYRNTRSVFDRYGNYYLFDGFLNIVRVRKISKLQIKQIVMAKSFKGLSIIKDIAFDIKNNMYVLGFNDSDYCVLVLDKNFNILRNYKGMKSRSNHPQSNSTIYTSIAIDEQNNLYLQYFYGYMQKYKIIPSGKLKFIVEYHNQSANCFIRIKKNGYIYVSGDRNIERYIPIY